MPHPPILQLQLALAETASAYRLDIPALGKSVAGDLYYVALEAEQRYAALAGEEAIRRVVGDWLDRWLWLLRAVRDARATTDWVLLPFELYDEYIAGPLIRRAEDSDLCLLSYGWSPEVQGYAIESTDSFLARVGTPGHDAPVVAVSWVELEDCILDLRRGVLAGS